MILIKILLFIVALTFSLTVKSDGIEITGIVETHNKIRNKLNVGSLEWSSQLASFAQTWADYLANRNRCTMQHRPKTGKFAQLYGENIYWGSAVIWTNGAREIQKVSGEEVVNAWASEVKDYNYEKNLCKSGEICGHYTQLVWEKSKQVGCAVSICPELGQILVCNYNPPGNYIGERPY